MSGSEQHESSGEVGYKRPPASTRFPKGQSGNPKGRPRGRYREIPYDSLLGQMVTIREDGRERRVTAAEAFLLQLTQKGLAGDSTAARTSLAAIEEARAKRRPQERVSVIRILFFTLSVGTSLSTLGISVKRNPLSEEHVRWELNPWIVETALARLRSRILSEEEQREVWKNTRTPDRVAWPEWWTIRV